MMLISPSTEGSSNCDRFEASIFNFFKKKKVEQFRPILLSAIHQKELGYITEEKYDLFIKYLYDFYVCYAIIG